MTISRIEVTIRALVGTWIAPGATSAWAAAINDAGDIVGAVTFPTEIDAFEYRQGTFTTFKVHPGSKETFASAVNYAGVVVGYFVPLHLGFQGFASHGESFIRVNFPGAIETAPLNIDQTGNIVGFYADSQGMLHGFLRTN